MPYHLANRVLVYGNETVAFDGRPPTDEMPERSHGRRGWARRRQAARELIERYEHAAGRVPWGLSHKERNVSKVDLYYHRPS